MSWETAKNSRAGTNSHTVALSHIRDNACKSILVYTTHKVMPVTAIFKMSLPVFHIFFLSMYNAPDLVCFFISRFKVYADTDLCQEADGYQLYSSQQ